MRCTEYNHRSVRIVGRLVETGEVVTLTVKGSIITDVTPGMDQADIGCADEWLAPGFHDLQVNGYAGHDFNSGAWGLADDASDFPDLQRALAAHGTALFCPTIITDDAEAMSRNLHRVACEVEEDSLFRSAVTGIHLEGPFLSPEDGPRGAHPVEHLRPPDIELFHRFQDAARGLIRMVTVAPELPGAVAFIERLVQEGIVVAIGHTAATPEVIREAVAAGATVSTHLGNGCHAFLPRHQSYLWEQLASDALTATLIGDGRHLDPAEFRVFVRAKGVERVAFISDAVRLAGLPPGLYAGGRFRVASDGTVWLEGTPYLAGASKLLDTAVANSLRWAGLTLRDAVHCVTEVPARVLGCARKGQIAAGREADLTCFRLDDGGEAGAAQLEITATVTGGHVIYRAPGHGL